MVNILMKRLIIKKGTYQAFCNVNKGILFAMEKIF